MCLQSHLFYSSEMFGNDCLQRKPSGKLVFRLESVALCLGVHICMWAYQQLKKKQAQEGCFVGLFMENSQYFHWLVLLVCILKKFGSYKGSKPIWSSFNDPRWARILEKKKKKEDNSFVERSPRNKARAGRGNGDVHRQLAAWWLHILPVKCSVLSSRFFKYLLFLARLLRSARCQFVIMFFLWCQFLLWCQSISTHASREGYSGCWGTSGREWVTCERQRLNKNRVLRLHSKLASTFSLPLH